jgi:AraC-like DNA-binding protein
VFKFIENNYTQAISLNDLSESLNLSSSYLSTSVRKMTGRTVSEWIRERRMAEARRLLLETDDDVVQIAEMIGYKEVTYFIRQFRQLHFKTPQVWRQVNY